MDKISDLKNSIIKTLDINKAQDIISIDLKDKSSMADFMIIASGTSSRHIQSLSEQVLDCLLYTSDAADDYRSVDLGGRRIIKKNFFRWISYYLVIYS